MYDLDSVEKLVNNAAHVQYVKNFKDQLQYYAIPAETLVDMLNQVYLKAYADAFEQSDAQTNAWTDT